MGFPHINTKATNLTITPALEELLEQKFQPLGKFLGDSTAMVCTIELARVAEHQSGKIYRAEINLDTGETLYRAEATEEQIEQAIDSIRNELRNELKRAHDK